MSARKLALETLLRLEKDKSYSNIAVDNAIRKHGLTGAERSLFCILVYGVIERRITLDYVIDSLSSLPPHKIEADTRMLLRMGLYQLMYLDRIPPHAILNETVELAPRRSRGFVNALLRAYTRTKEDIEFPKREEDCPLYLSVTYSYPTPLCQKLIADYGEEVTEQMLGAFNATPEITLRTNTLKITREALLESLMAKGLSVSLTENAPHGIKIASGGLADIGMEEGLFFVQDEASQICVEVLGAKAGDTVYDICSCPGSKSFGAALNMGNAGQILSTDLHENKLSLVTRSAEMLGITILRTAARDGRNLDSTLVDTADCVLCDVPCSGFGVVAKKPEIRYKDLSECKALPDIQYDILDTACRYVKKGGTLVYSTCTIFPEENEENIRRFLTSHPEFSLVPFRVGKVEAKDGMRTLLPHEFGTDGFFIAKLTRKE